MALMSGRSWDDWIAEYGLSHKDRRNRFCHTIGIPLIVASLLAAGVALAIPRVWPFAALLFVVGWAFQFVGPFLADGVIDNLAAGRLPLLGLADLGVFVFLWLFVLPLVVLRLGRLVGRGVAGESSFLGFMGSDHAGRR